MKLIDYVVRISKRAERMTKVAIHEGVDIKDYIMTAYCPAAFDELENSPYCKPFKPEKQDKNYCKHLSGDNQDVCNKCWNREVLVIANET